MRSNRLSYRPLSGTSSNYTSGFAEGQIASLNKVFNLELRLQFSLVAQRLDAKRHRQAHSGAYQRLALAKDHFVVCLSP